MRFTLLMLLGGCQVVFPLERDKGKVCGGNGLTALTSECVTANVHDLELVSTINTGTLADPGDNDCDEVIEQSDPAHTEVCLITGATIEVGNVTVTGIRPLVIVASGPLTVSQTLSVASHLFQPAGAGGDFAGCAKGLDGEPTDAPDGASGGAGGSFASSGGDGAVGNMAGNSGVPGGLASFDGASITFIRGGCFGGDGGKCTGKPARGGAGGHGGGAVYLVAGGTLTVTGTIDASGAGGEGGRAGNGDGGGGGGGAGSGGLIGLDAPHVVIGPLAVMIANGGGGGAGGPSGGADGGDGTNPDVADGSPFTGLGGFSNAAGEGGNGATAAGGAVDGKSESMNGGGGGGGGGGLGVIVVAGSLDRAPGSRITPDPLN